jgi:uncharacterized membrane protein
MPDWARGGPMALWRRRRWPVVASGAGALIILYLITQSILETIVLLIVLVALVIVALIFAARHAERPGQQPAVQRGPSQAGRDAQDVWQAALRHLPETFTTTPDRALFAADLIELRMNPDDLRALAESIDPGLVTTSSSDAYRARIAEHGARISGSGEPRVAMVSDPDLPPGRYRLRPRPSEPLQQAAPAPASGGGMGGDWRDAQTMAQDPRTATEEQLTVNEKLPVPPLRLLTGGTVAEARKSGARIGRGAGVELRLPDVPTVSRVHAELTYDDGQWWITNQGRNGLTVNGNPVTGQSPVSDGDVIQWGNRHDALTSRVQVG